MENIKRKFENETKTRINVIGSDNYGKINLQRILTKDGIFDRTDFTNGNSFTIFPTEILCSATRSNRINLYLSIKKKEEVIKHIKEVILNSIYEASIVIDNNKQCVDEVEKFKLEFISVLNQFSELHLNKFYEVDNIETVFKSIEFNELLKDIKAINCMDNPEIIDDKHSKDDVIWHKYFTSFESDFQKQYYKWIELISRYYIISEYGQEYISQNEDNINKYSNTEFYSLCNILYGIKSSCALVIKRAYIEVPSSREQFVGNAYIYNSNDIRSGNIVQMIENRVSEDYKELFVILANSIEEINCFSIIKDNINKVTINRRIFCILNEFDRYMGQTMRDEAMIKSFDINGDLINIIKDTISKNIGISSDKTIITEQYKDIDEKTLKTLDSYNELYKLLKLIRNESEKFGKAIKIKPTNKDSILNITLNQERMTVQALMGMLYERYNGYLVDLWRKIIVDEEKNNKQGQYCYSKIRTIISNRKDNYKEYKHVIKNNSNLYHDHNNIIDFSLRSGDNNDSKKILKMLVNYGYHTVGFNSNENKILVTVNGEISNEDKENLIKSIKGRLEESVINYFESAFLMEVSGMKFNTNSLYKAQEIEKNITIDDFYRAFKEIFKKMSDNIVKYEVYIQ